MNFQEQNLKHFYLKLKHQQLLHFGLNKDNREKDFPNLIITPSKPPSLIKVFDPSP